MNKERTKELIRVFNENNPIARYIGMKLSFTDTGNAVIDLPYNPNLDHTFGAIHGGVYATMLDSAGSLTAAAIHDASCILATSELTIHFLLPAKCTSLRALGTILKSGSRQDVVDARLFNEQGQLVGHAIGIFVAIPKRSTLYLQQ